MTFNAIYEKLFHHHKSIPTRSDKEDISKRPSAYSSKPQNSSEASSSKSFETASTSASSEKIKNLHLFLPDYLPSTPKVKLCALIFGYVEGYDPSNNEKFEAVHLAAFSQVKIKGMVSQIDKYKREGRVVLVKLKQGEITSVKFHQVIYDKLRGKNISKAVFGDAEEGIECKDDTVFRTFKEGEYEDIVKRLIAATY